jgi:hypothetical protein
VPWLRQRKVDDGESTRPTRGSTRAPGHGDHHPTPEVAEPKYPVTPYEVTVLLNQERIEAHPRDGYEPLGGYIKAIEFTVEATSPLAACEVAYAVTNSTPDDMHCDVTYREVVKTYRNIGNFRSVAVDDLLEIDGVRFTCARFGFRLLPA